MSMSPEARHKEMDMGTAGMVARRAAALLTFAAIAACSTSKDKKEDGAASSKASALPDDAVVGSCQAKDGSFCDEYKNRASLKEDARSVELSMTKGACESELKNGSWREGKGCEPKGEIGHCVVDKRDSMKRASYWYKGDEEMTAAGCKDLMEGKWESGLADGAVLGRCVVGSSCTEVRNNKQLDADSRARYLKNESDSCGRLEGEFTPGKACETASPTARCTVKGEYRLTSVRTETNKDKQAIADAKELCAISEGSVFEDLSAKK